MNRWRCRRGCHPICHENYLMKILFMLLITKSTHGQKDTTTSLPQSVRGRLCCPEDHTYESGECLPISNNTTLIFDPPIENKDVSPDVSWKYQEFECPIGYNTTLFTLDDIFNWLVVDEGVLYMKWRELLQKTTEDFCVGVHPSGEYLGAICRPIVERLCQDATCVQKCCGRDEIALMNETAFECVPSSRVDFRLRFQSVSGIDVSEPTDLMVLHRIPDCEHHILHLHPEREVDERFLLTRDGFLYQPAREHVIQKTQFCLDYFEIDGEMGTQMSAFICSGPGLPTEPHLKFYFYAAGLMISAVSLTVTILCNNLIPKLRVIQDINQLCHIISLLVGEIALFIGYMFSSDIHSIHCVINGIIAQFALLSAFFWLNVMCFDIHQYLRATNKLIPRSAIQGGRDLRFRLYCVYAWGSPFCITLVTAVLHFLPSNPDKSILKPGFGVITCWFYGDIERLTFFYIWVGALFIGNIFLLAHTAFMLYQTGVMPSFRKKSVFEQGDSRVNNRKHAEKFWQSFNLFALMALCWVTEILSWQIPPESLWIPTDILNTLQGFFIFIFFLRTEKKRKILKETVGRAVCRISESARKFSRSEGSSGTVWHCTHSGTATTELSRFQQKSEEGKDERENQQEVDNPML